MSEANSPIGTILRDEHTVTFCLPDGDCTMTVRAACSVLMALRQIDQITSLAGLVGCEGGEVTRYGRISLIQMPGNYREVVTKSVECPRSEYLALEAALLQVLGADFETHKRGFRVETEIIDIVSV